MQRVDFFIFLCVVAVILSSGCAKKNNSSSYYDAELFVKLVDAPAGIEKLTLTIQRVEIHSANLPLDIAWKPVTENLQIYEVLSLRNGNFEWLVADKIPAGSYDKIRILFNIGSVVIDGNEYQLRPDPSIAGGCILEHAFTVGSGERYQLTVDLDVGESIKEKFDVVKYYVLRPKIRLQPTLLSGSIAGQILNPDSTVANVIVQTIIPSTSDVVSTYPDNTTGSFQLTDIPEGFYTVNFIPIDTLTYATLTVDSVRVIAQTRTLLTIKYLEYK